METIVDTASKILAIDVGNSSTKIGCFLEGQLEATEYFATEQDSLSVCRKELQGIFPPGQGNMLDGVIVSSVVPDMNPALQEILTSMFPENNIVWLQRENLSQFQLGQYNFSYYQPQALGTDRIANIMGGAVQFPEKKILVCDFGTTTTFDLMDEAGVFLGGAICPGPRKFQSLISVNHAAQLFEVDVFQKPAKTPGLTTQECLENGLYYGYKGIILEIIGNLFQESQWPLSQVNILFTGGYATEVREMVRMEIPSIHIDMGLTLKGLYRLWELRPESLLLKKQ